MPKYLLISKLIRSSLLTSAVLTSMTLLSGCGGDSNNEVDLPTVTLGEDFTVFPGEYIRLTATATDPANQGLTYSWSQKSGTPVEITSIQGDSDYVLVTTPAPSSTPVVIEVTITDGHGNAISDEISFTVKHINRLNYFIAKSSSVDDDILSCRQKVVDQQDKTTMLIESEAGEDQSCFTDDDIVNEATSYELVTIDEQQQLYRLEFQDGDCRTIFHQVDSGMISHEEYHPSTDQCSYIPSDDPVSTAGFDRELMDETAFPLHEERYAIINGEKMSLAWDVYEYSNEALTSIKVFADAGPDEMLYTPDDILHHQVEYSYDEEGYLLSSTSHAYVNANNPLRQTSLTVYEYDNAGIITSSITYNSAGEDMDWTTLEDNNVQSQVYEYRPLLLYPMEG